jgi:hypothetical protein
MGEMGRYFSWVRRKFESRIKENGPFICHISRDTIHHH